MRFYLFGPRLLGIRTGISFDARDFQQTPKRQDRQHIYVVKGDHEMVKIGVTTNLSARLAQLQTGSSLKLEYAFTAPVSGDAYTLERRAHSLLERDRVSGEWFNVSPELAIAAVNGAAAKLNYSLTTPATTVRSLPRGTWTFLFIGWAFVGYLVYLFYRSLP